MHIVREQEECIVRTYNTIQLARPLPLFLVLQRWHLTLEQGLPLFLLSIPRHFPLRYRSMGLAFSAGFTPFSKGRARTRGPPRVGFPACETGTVDARLLACIRVMYRTTTFSEITFANSTISESKYDLANQSYCNPRSSPYPPIFHPSRISHPTHCLSFSRLPPSAPFCWRRLWYPSRTPVCD